MEYKQKQYTQPIDWILMKDKKPRKGQKIIGLWNWGGINGHLVAESLTYFKVYDATNIVAWYPLEIPEYVKDSVEK